MSHGPTPYVVRQGDTLLSIAVAHGVDPGLIWNEPKNAELAQVKRRDPDMLGPGDVIYIPSERPPDPGVSLKARNRFRGAIPTVEVRFAFRGERGPLAGEPYEVTGVDDPKNEPILGRLDAAGVFKMVLPVGLKEFLLRFPKQCIEHRVEVGRLNPYDDLSGMRRRLLHLGYRSVRQADGTPVDFTDPESERLTLQWFQRAQGLEPTGFPDEATLARIALLSGA